MNVKEMISFSLKEENRGNTNEKKELLLLLQFSSFLGRLFRTNQPLPESENRSSESESLHVLLVWLSLSTSYCWRPRTSYLGECHESEVGGFRQNHQTFPFHLIITCCGIHQKRINTWLGVSSRTGEEVPVISWKWKLSQDFTLFYKNSTQRQGSVHQFLEKIEMIFYENTHAQLNDSRIKYSLKNIRCR